MMDNGNYVLKSYYRTEIPLDTALDARHLLSVFKSFCPNMKCTFEDKVVRLDNVRNHMLQKIYITWKHQI